MSLTVTCPDCDKTLKVKDEVAGKKVRCPACSAVISVPKKSSDDDFLDDLEPAPRKRKRRAEEDDFGDDDLEDSAPRTRKTKGTKKKSGRGKSGGASWALIGGLVGGGLIGLLFVAMLVAAIGQAQKAGGNRSAQQVAWPTFRHPMGCAQVDMPGTPTLNAQQSVNGSQTYSLIQSKYQMSLTAAALPANALLAITTNPDTVNLMFNEMETKTPQQMPGAKLISSQRMMNGAVPGLELKIDVQGNINTMRFYVCKTALVGAEFITRNESAHAADRERFFNSFKDGEGNPFNSAAPAPNAAHSSSPTSAAPAGGSAGTPGTLADARRALKTKLVRQEQAGRSVPDPPPAIARTVRYDAPSGKLAAYVTNIPQDGKRYPGIVWVSGGDCNTIDDGFFTDSPPNNDQTASAFRKAGIVTMYPSLRGGNDNPGFKEGFLGEIDDVIAAGDFLSKQDGIDPNRIYLAGHSTGGTVALLTAESSNRFRAIFSFGPAEDIRGYGQEFLYFDSRIPAEIDARTPGKWIDSIQSRTFVLEGKQGNFASLQAMQRASRNPQVTFIAVSRANHFNILAPATRLIAEKILQDVGPTTNISLTESDLNLKYAR